MLCNGRFLTHPSLSDPKYDNLKSLLQAAGHSKLPDLRDMFLRGLPASGRAIGDFQSDAFGNHTHSYRHTYSMGTPGQYGNYMSLNHGAHNEKGLANFNVDMSGDSETRPKNIAVN